MLESLQLDAQSLPKNREDGKQEFLDFRDSVQSNFNSIQNNFVSIQTNFEKLFATRKADVVEQSGSTPQHLPTQMVFQPHL